LPLDADRGLVVGTAVLRTADGGQSWEVDSALEGMPPQLELGMTEDGFAWILFQDGRVICSYDSARTWTHQYVAECKGFGWPAQTCTFVQADVGWLSGQGGSLARTDGPPRPFIPNVQISRGDTLRMVVPLRGDSAQYSFVKLKGPEDMTVSPGGTIVYSPSVDTFALTHVGLLMSDPEGRHKTVEFTIIENPDSRLDTRSVAGTAALRLGRGTPATELKFGPYPTSGAGGALRIDMLGRQLERTAGHVAPGARILVP
jgi:hypothetical protein